jgi:hypothetical protein
MRLSILKSAHIVMLLALLSGSTANAQDVHVQVGKRATAVPKICEQVVPASIEGQVDIPALLKEADCKGAGDMLGEYTYVMKIAKREKDSKGRIKEETTLYEVYFPTPKSGTRARGVLLVTSRNGVPVPQAELEKERLQAGERLEKEENKSARDAAPQPEPSSEHTNAMLPLGMYPRMRNSRSAFGMRRGGVALNLHTLLKISQLTLTRRKQIEGRDALVFSFTTLGDAQLADDEKYIAQLRGTIWIDAKDRIVTRLMAWPSSMPNTSGTQASMSSGDQPPAIYLEMTRLPEGVWLPKTTRINGADYQKFFDHILSDTTVSYSEYKRFLTETEGVELETPKGP